jgi:hypothetical protein
MLSALDPVVRGVFSLEQRPNRGWALPQSRLQAGAPKPSRLHPVLITPGAQEL